MRLPERSTRHGFANTQSTYVATITNGKDLRMLVSIRDLPQTLPNFQLQLHCRGEAIVFVQLTTPRSQGESCATVTSHGSSSPRRSSHNFRVAFQLHEACNQSQFIPLPIIGFGCTLARTSRQSASLDFTTMISFMKSPQSPSLASTFQLHLEHLFLSLLLIACICPCRRPCSLTYITPGSRATMEGQALI